jgi:hypothetical protein
MNEKKLDGKIDFEIDQNLFFFIFSSLSSFFRPTDAFTVNQGTLNERECHGQTSANRTKPGPSFQLLKWLYVRHALLFL